MWFATYNPADDKCYSSGTTSWSDSNLTNDRWKDRSLGVLARTVAIVVGSVVLAACSPMQQSQHVARRGGTQHGAAIPYGALPSDAADRFADQGLATADVLLAQETAACMSAAGFTYTPPPVSLPRSQEHRQGRYGADTPYIAAQWGYGGPPTEAAEVGPDTSSESASYRRALEGRTDDAIVVSVEVPGGTLHHRSLGGCTGNAVTAVFESRDRYLELLSAMSRVEAFSNESMTRLVASQVYNTTVASWSSCMNDTTGRSFTDPWEAAAAGFADLETERHIALADIECKRAVDLIQNFNAFEHDWQNTQLEQMQSAIDRLSTATDLIVAKAQSGSVGQSLRSRVNVGAGRCHVDTHFSNKFHCLCNRVWKPDTR